MRTPDINFTEVPSCVCARLCTRVERNSWRWWFHVLRIGIFLNKGGIIRRLSHFSPQMIGDRHLSVRQNKAEK